MNHIVKRAGHAEKFDEKKVYASIYSSCLSVTVPVGTAELIAQAVTKDVKHWMSHKHEVTANDIRRQASTHLKAYNLDAAYIYLHHRVIH